MSVFLFAKKTLPQTKQKQQQNAPWPCCLATYGDQEFKKQTLQSRGERGRLYLTLHCHHQNDSCIKMGIDESCFNPFIAPASKISRLKSEHTCLQTVYFPSCVKQI